MAKKNSPPDSLPSDEGGLPGDLEGLLDSGDSFPETHMSLIIDAAAGEWSPFLREYLRPCWREVLLVCRQWNLPAPDADDLFQELMVRLFQPGSFRLRAAEAIAAVAPGTKLKGNSAERYLVYTQAVGKSAKFRTYLKQMILNVVRERVRSRAKSPKQLDSETLSGFEPEVEQSISRSLDDRWFEDCLAAACDRLFADSQAAKTKGRRRLFELFYSMVVDGDTIEAIAQRLDIHRSALSPYVAQSRNMFIEHLQAVTGIDELPELMALLVQHRQALKTALKATVEKGTETKGS